MTAVRRVDFTFCNDVDAVAEGKFLTRKRAVRGGMS